MFLRYRNLVFSLSPFSLQFFIFFSLFSFILAWTFISLQIKEFRIMCLSINDSVNICLFFFLTVLHFFHLCVGLFVSCIFFWSCSFCKFLSSGALLSFTIIISTFIIYYYIILLSYHLVRNIYLKERSKE